MPPPEPDMHEGDDRHHGPSQIPKEFWLNLSRNLAVDIDGKARQVLAEAYGDNPNQILAFCHHVIIRAGGESRRITFTDEGRVVICEMKKQGGSHPSKIYLEKPPEHEKLPDQFDDYKAADLALTVAAIMEESHLKPGDKHPRGGTMTHGYSGA